MTIATDTRTEIRAIIDQWTAAICRRDVDGILAAYDPGVTVFDAIPPFAVSGAGELRKSWESCFPHMPAEFGLEIRDLEIAAGEDTAFAHWMFRFTGPDQDHPALQSWMRATSCYRKRDGRWRIVHDHISVPFDPYTSKAVLTLAA
jgi:uncharacterized protein (TIGR02246 family)